jgi:hypothetical protein
MNPDLRYDSLMAASFINACHDYYYLLNRHFPERGVLKLVGDRYRLDGDQRTVLYRGISSSQRAAYRESLLVNDFKGHHLVVDGYNVLFSLLNYRLGRMVFISTDTIVRDAGSLHGRLRNEKTFLDCLDILINYLAEKQPEQVDIYLDSPVSHSGKHAVLIREKMAEMKLKGGCYVIQSADYALKHNYSGIIATSDTAIIEKSMMPVIDLPRGVLEVTYGAELIELAGLLPSGQVQYTVDEG